MTAKRYVDVFELYNRFVSGERMTEETWDYHLIPEAAKSMKERYDIKFDSNKIIPEDQDLIDRLFLAGVDMLITCGLYNVDTGTRMQLTEDELYEGLKMAPCKIVLGEGKDSVTCDIRSGNPINRPVIIGGPTGSPVSEDIYMPIIESYARESTVDGVVTGILRTVKGISAAKNTPWEIRAALTELGYTHRALYNSGRPGMAI